MWPKIWHSKPFTWSISLLAIALRITYSTTPAQPYDIGTYHAWGNHLLSVGPRHFFDKIWSDYLPLPILTFGIPTWISQTFSLDFSFVFKLFHSLIEIILILALPSLSILPKLLLLLSPALIGDTSWWGQVDSIPALLALLSLSQLLRPSSPKIWNLTSVVSAALYGLAVAYKPIMILVAPILWIVSLKRGLGWQFPLVSGLTFLAWGIPTGGGEFISHLATRILDQAGTYPFMTINAWNLWSLVPINSWLPDTTSVLGISARTTGLILFCSTTLITLNYWRKHGFSPAYAPRTAATILILFYTFTTRMHERHLLFGLPFLALAIQYQKFLLYPFLLYTALFILNLYSAFFWVNHNQTWPFPEVVASWVSWLTVITSLALSLVWDWPKLLKSGILHLKSHRVLVAILLLASALRLTNLSHPRAYIFDEVYHAFTSKEYLHSHIAAWEWWTTPPEGVAYEWTHPPVAKYGMVLGMLLFGENEFGYRLGSAVFGIVSIVGIYLLSQALFPRSPIPLLAAFLVSIEGLHISQSRIAMNDIYLLNFLIWSLYLAIKSRWKYSAVLFGLALGSKWSAIYGLVPLALIYLHHHWPSFRNLKSSILNLFGIIRLLLITSAVYVLTFTPFVLAGHTWEQFLELHRQMWYYHTHLVATHGYQSTPIQWIVSARPVWYWVNYGAGVVSNIYAQANPVLLWLGLVAFILTIPKIKQFPYLLLTTCYLILTLPWIMSPRIMFFYHYLPSATFLCILLAAWLTHLTPRVRNGLIVLCFIGLILVSPMLYGFPLPQVYWDTVFRLFPSWK